jgi:hypothetical protein
MKLSVSLTLKLKTRIMKKMDTSIPYYEDMTRISNSDIGHFLMYGPKEYYNYKNNKGIKLEGKFLETGTMIHEYILQPEIFWDDYVILDFETPKVKQQRDFIENYVLNKAINPLEAEDKILLQVYNSAYSNSKPDNVKLDEAKKLVETYQGYIKYIENRDDKFVISYADLNGLKKIEANLKAHKKANELLYNLPATFETHNEFHINWEVEKFGVKCKSLLDRVCFDHVNKKIILIDLKTTGNVYDFKHSVDTFNYYRQIAYYSLAIQWYMQEVLNLNSEEYDFEAYIIAIGKDADRQVRVFDMLSNESKISESLDIISNSLQKISEHIKTNQWDHSLEYINGDGVEEL